MVRSIYAVKRNINILQKKQENNSANIANLNTPGYKFQSIVQSTLKSENMINYSGGSGMNKRQELGEFVFGNKIDAFYKSFEQGSLYETNKGTDFAIVGNGFFTIRTDGQNKAFTRNGNFRLDEENRLVTQEGHPVLGIDDGGQETCIYTNSNDLNVDDKGNIIGKGIRFLISDFRDYDGLQNIGDTVFISDEDAEQIETRVNQRFLEASNTSVADELIKMIEISREFESNQKLLRAADETLSKAVNEIGRV